MLSQNKSFNDTSPVESPVSYKDMVFILTLLILAVPLCIIPLWFGVAEPVKIYFPFLLSLSTSKRTASQSDGTSCHSSIKRGKSPFNTKSGLICAIVLVWKLFSGFPTKAALLALLLAVQVLPQYFGPSIQTAPKVCIYSSNCFSTSLDL